MISIQYISDIHLEFLHIEKIKSITRKIIPISPILVLAGDIGNPFHSGYELFIKEMALKFEKIFLITGNHEYYGGKSIEETEDKIRSIVYLYKNVSYLQNSYEDYKEFRWLGTTLWSKISDSSYNINDIYSIKNMTKDTYNSLHQKSIDFLRDSLEEKNDIKYIIITHHLPSYKLIDEQFLDPKVSMYNQWFASSLDESIMIKYNDRIKGWFYGHTHIPFKGTLYNINLYCNPVGYKGENKKIEYNKILF